MFHRFIKNLLFQDKAQEFLILLLVNQLDLEFLSLFVFFVLEAELQLLQLQKHLFWIIQVSSQHYHRSKMPQAFNIDLSNTHLSSFLDSSTILSNVVAATSGVPKNTTRALPELMSSEDSVERNFVDDARSLWIVEITNLLLLCNENELCENSVSSLLLKNVELVVLRDDNDDDDKTFCFNDEGIAKLFTLVFTWYNVEKTTNVMISISCTITLEDAWKGVCRAVKSSLLLLC